MDNTVGRLELPPSRSMDAVSPDVGGRSRAPLPVLEGSSFYKSFFENLAQYAFSKDAQGRYTFVNQPLCDLLQRPLEEILGFTDYDFYPVSLAAKYRKDDQQVLSTLTPMESVEVYQLPSHAKIHVQVLRMPARDASGAVIGVQGLFWDVTDRKRKEATLVREHEFLSALLDHVPDMIYFKDVESRFIKCSRSVATRLGLENVSEIIGKTDFDLFAREHAVQAVQDEQEIMQTGRPLIAKVEKEVKKDGTEVWVLTTKVPLRNKLGIPIGTFGISKEITELKRVEAELALARDAALESARLKSEFLANMSHELRTPMNAIIGMTGFLLQTELGAEQRDFAETIRTSASALLEIVSDILDFSRIEAGGMSLQQVGFDLRELAETSLDLVGHKAQAQGLELVLRFLPGVRQRLKGDPHRLRQVLLNLLSNAIKFTETGEIVVEVGVVSASPERSEIRFEVRDTGIGIPAHAHQRIFDSFTQADGTTTRKYGGTGLGLSICQRLVDLMGGKIGFESEEGRGSTFWFQIPLEHDPLAPAAGADWVPPRAARALVVCDHVSTGRMLADFLRALGVRVDLAEDTASAQTACARAVQEAAPFTLVLVEHRLPLIDGLGFVQSLQRDPSTSGLRPILITSPGLAIKLTKAPQEGVGGCLAKPIKPSRLLDSISSIGASTITITNATGRTGAGETASSEAGFPPSLRILLAEDNPLNRKVALRQLKQLGLSADAAENGLEAVRRLESHAYDILVLDCQMPFMDGYEVARTIRKREQVAAQFDGRAVRPLHIIAMTANALEGDREKCLNAGMDDYLSKPAKTGDLRSALQRGVERLGLVAASVSTGE